MTAPPPPSVPCHRCGVPFEMGTASWCRCVVVEPSLVCPRCGECLCHAPLAVRQAFWAEAPAALRSARREFAERARSWSPPPNPPSSLVRRPLILLVEDDAALHEVIADLAQSLGRTLVGTIVHAFDGRQGLQLARQYRPDLVLTDVLMSKLEGREMCRLIKNDPALTGVRVVIMTGVNTSPRDQADGVREFQADDYITKPFRFATLHGMLQKQLSLVLNESRQAPRFDVALPVRLSWSHPATGPQEEITFTVNLSKGGALVVCHLPVAKGDIIVFEEQDGVFRTRATIQAISIGADNLPRLSLRFLDAELPDRLLPNTRPSPGPNPAG